MKNKIKTKGFLALELYTGIALLTILTFCFAVSMNGFARINDYHIVKQRCIAAAQAQLDSIELTGTELSKEQFDCLWPKIDCQIQQTSPTDQWKGTKLIKVSAVSQSFNHKVKIELCRYIPQN
jgi:hypothetical protein